MRLDRFSPQMRASPSPLSMRMKGKKYTCKTHSDRVCVIAYYGVVLSTLPVRIPSQQYTASAIQILLIAATDFPLYIDVLSCFGATMSTPHGANSVY
jgi:hypothetical protein